MTYQGDYHHSKRTDIRQVREDEQTNGPDCYLLTDGRCSRSNSQNKPAVFGCGLKSAGGLLHILTDERSRGHV